APAPPHAVSGGRRGGRSADGSTVRVSRGVRAGRRHAQAVRRRRPTVEPLRAAHRPQGPGALLAGGGGLARRHVSAWAARVTSPFRLPPPRPRPPHPAPARRGPP